jgi:predicted small metal-binding protein
VWHFQYNGFYTAITVTPLQGNVGNGTASQVAYITVFDRRILYDTRPHVAARRRQLSRTCFISRFKRSMIMLKFACKDVGVECDFVATGATTEEVKEKAFAHAGVVHADMLKAMNKDELAQMTKAVEANIKPE